MLLANCTDCGRLFRRHSESQEACGDCQEKFEGEFRRIRQYIATHPGTSIQHLSEQTGISHRKILSWIREGRMRIPH